MEAISVGRIKHSPVFTFQNIQIRGKYLAITTKNGVCVSTVDISNTQPLSHHVYKAIVDDTASQRPLGTFLIGDPAFPHVAVCMPESLDIYPLDMEARLFRYKLDADAERVSAGEIRAIAVTQAVSTDGALILGTSAGFIHILTTDPAYRHSLTIPPAESGLTTQVMGIVPLGDGTCAVVDSTGAMTIIRVTGVDAVSSASRIVSRRAGGPHTTTCVAPVPISGHIMSGRADGSIAVTRPDTKATAGEVVIADAHSGPVMSIAVEAGVVASVAADGILRVTKVDPTHPTPATPVTVERVMDTMLCGVGFVGPKTIATLVCDAILVPMFRLGT